MNITFIYFELFSSPIDTDRCSSWIGRHLEIFSVVHVPLMVVYLSFVHLDKYLCKPVYPYIPTSWDPCMPIIYLCTPLQYRVYTHTNPCMPRIPIYPHVCPCIPIGWPENTDPRSVDPLRTGSTDCLTHRSTDIPYGPPLRTTLKQHRKTKDLTYRVVGIDHSCHSCRRNLNRYAPRI